MELTRTSTLAAAWAVLALGMGCEHEPERQPNWLFKGEWLDVDGFDREASDTCAGTFEYLDRYAGALAIEFGVSRHLGTYQWFSNEAWTLESPCPDSAGCALPGIAYSTYIPHEHELVHLANFHSHDCPDLLAEGLAEYYDTLGSGGVGDDFTALGESLTKPASKPHNYTVAGRFAAFLVERFGLPAVLEVCAATGEFPDATTFASAFEDVLGTSLAELLADLEDEPPECHGFERYQSRVFACGVAEAAPDAGTVTSEQFDRTYEMGCESDAVNGPLGGMIRVIERIDIAEAGTYRFWLWGEDGSIGTQPPPVDLIVAECGPCGEVAVFDEPDDFLTQELELEAGRYWLELRAPADFSDTLELTILRM